MMKNFLSLIIVTILLSVVAPVFAQNSYLHHSALYSAEGSIDLKKQAGHRCNSGAEMKQLVTGDGYLSKSSDIYLISGLLDVDDNNEIKTAESALENLTVTSAILLCAPPKLVFKDESSLDITTSGMFNDASDEIDIYYHYAKGSPVPPHLSYLFPNWYGDNTLEDNIERISEQIWAASIAADPGFEAVLTQKFTAAYGPFYGGLVHEAYDDMIYPVVLLDFSPLKGVPSESDLDKWWLLYKDRGLMPVLGKRYVGNYFTIEQFLGNSQGVSKRYIDISSPWNHGYLFEDMDVAGKAEVRETFEMLNLPAGNDLEVDWWLFDRSRDDINYTLYDDYYLPSTGSRPIVYD
jgi:hypothetical protein